MSALALQNWFPDERPGTAEIAIAVIVFLDVAFDFYEGVPVVWPLFVAGFLACLIAWGPLAASPVGTRIGEWARGIGVGGRILVILAVVASLWAAYTLSLIPSTPVASVAKGFMFAVAVVITARLLAARFAG